MMALGACTGHPAAHQAAPTATPQPAIAAVTPSNAGTPAAGNCAEADAVKLCAEGLAYQAQIDGVDPGAGNHYLSVMVSVASNSQDAVYAFPTNMSLVDATGTEYPCSLAAAFLDDGLTPTTLLAGDRITGMITFEIPITATQGKLRAKALPGKPPIELDLSSLIAKAGPA
jgi:hypothetical protein